MTNRSRAVLWAIVTLEERGERATANRIARLAAERDPEILAPVRRHGRGAVSRSWSGTAADCHRILGSLGALRKAGFVFTEYERGYATRYYPTDEGRSAISGD